MIAHDFGAWVAFIWALLFGEDFKSLTLIDAGIPGITLTEDVQLSDYKRKWNFIFQMLPDLPAELIEGKEDIYVGWWFKNEVYRLGAITPQDAAAYAQVRPETDAWMRRSTTAAGSSTTWSWRTAASARAGAFSCRGQHAGVEHQHGSQKAGVLCAFIDVLG